MRRASARLSDNWGRSLIKASEITVLTLCNNFEQESQYFRQNRNQTVSMLILRLGVFIAVLMCVENSAAGFLATEEAKDLDAAKVHTEKSDNTSGATSDTKAAKWRRLSFGIGIGYASNYFNRSNSDYAQLGTLAGGGGFQNAASQAVSLSGAQFITTASGTGTAAALNGIDLNAKIEYALQSWLFLRSGLGYSLILDNKYTASAAGTGPAGSDWKMDATWTASGLSVEIPILLGINFLQTDKSRIYFAVGVAYSIGSIKNVISETASGTAVINSGISTIADVSEEVKRNGFGVLSVVGAEMDFTENVSLFGEIKFLSSAAAGVEKIQSTIPSSGTTATTPNKFSSAAFGGNSLPANIANNADPAVYMNSKVSNSLNSVSSGTTNVTALDMSYIRWQFGINLKLDLGAKYPYLTW